MMALRPARGRLRPFHVKHLDQLPPPCAGCPRATMHTELPLWAKAAEDQWGQLGIGAWQDDELIGHLLVSPPLHAPRDVMATSGAFDHDAAVLVALRVADEWQQHGVAKHLIQASAAMLAGTRFTALEAVGIRSTDAFDGERTRGDVTAGVTCARPSAAVLELLGFTVVSPHPVFPRLRLDLRTTSRWRPAVDAAWDRVVGWVPAARPAPEPTSRAMES